MRPALLIILLLVSTVPVRAQQEEVRASVVEVLPWLEQLVGRPFGEIFEAHDVSADVQSKGSVGLLLEELLGLSPYGGLRDFRDAELKTNKSYPDGTPAETMFITQIASHIDELLGESAYTNSWLARKIEHIIYLPVVKEGPAETWYFLHYYDVHTGPGSPFHEQLEADYQTICRRMVQDVETGDGRIHTSSGRFLQIRTKDAKPYSPIYSAKYRKHVSDKNFAFYFKKEFMREVQRIEGSPKPQVPGPTSEEAK